MGWVHRLVRGRSVGFEGQWNRWGVSWGKVWQLGHLSSLLLTSLCMYDFRSLENPLLSCDSLDLAILGSLVSSELISGGVGVEVWSQDAVCSVGLVPAEPVHHGQQVLEAKHR